MILLIDRRSQIMSKNTSTFQSALSIVESLPVEEQAMLIEIVNNRLREQRRAELVGEVEQSERDYAEGNVKRGSVADFMADLNSL
jgi:hypothetical protein